MNSNLNFTIPKWVFAFKNFTEETAAGEFWTLPSVKTGLAYAGAFLTLAVLIIAMGEYILKKCIKKKPVNITGIFNPLARNPFNNARLVDADLGVLKY